jgi:UDP-GlcNAc:undecaprenyl-phosphate GlcNAc-1-phosphate transferase
MIRIEQWDLLSSAVFAFVLAASMIPITKQIAAAFGVVAAPNRESPNRRQIPLLAGAPIIVAILVSLAVFSAVPIWMLIGTVGLMLVGLFDDVVVMRPSTKFALQLIIVAVAVRCWQTPVLFAWPWLNSSFIMLWLLSTVNAFNLIDGLDGLAGGVGIAIALAIAVLGASHHNLPMVGEGLAVAGALAGFLVFNFHPASIFMGDCGALPLGFLLGAIALESTATAASSTLTVYSLPVLMMLVPLLDMTTVSISRMATSSPVTQRGRDHSHHKLLALGLPDQIVSEVCWIVAALSGACAVALAAMPYAYAVVALPFIAAVFGLIAFFMIDLTFESGRPGDTYDGTRGIARLLLNFGYKRRITEVLLDLVLISAAYLGAFLIRYDFVINNEKIQSILPNLPYVMAGSLTAFFAAGVYRGIWRYAGLTDVPRFAYAAIGAGVAVVVEAYFARIMLSGTIVVLFVMLLFYLLAASRLSFKAFREVIAMVAWAHRRVLIVGAGIIGEAAARYVTAGRSRGMKVVGLVDSDPFKTGSYVYGSVVLGTVAKLPEIQRSTKFNEILVACDPLAPEQMESVIAFARNHDLPVLRFSIAINELLGPRNNPIPATGGLVPLRNIASPEKVVA